MTGRPLPPYLAVVPAPGRRFRKPRKSDQPKAPPPLERDGESVATMIRNAERVAEIAERLHRAITEGDTLVLRALADRLEIEARFTASVARGLRAGTLCA